MQHRNNVNHFVQKLKPVIVCLQETICRNFYDLAKRSIGAYDTSSWIEVPLVGQSGGLITFWDPSLNVSEGEYQSGRYWILFRGKVISNKQFAIFNIYAYTEKV